jgi:hypothetical protein
MRTVILILGLLAVDAINAHLNLGLDLGGSEWGILILFTMVIDLIYAFKPSEG